MKEKGRYSLRKATRAVTNSYQATKLLLGLKPYPLHDRSQSVKSEDSREQNAKTHFPTPPRYAQRYGSPLVMFTAASSTDE